MAAAKTEGRVWEDTTLKVRVFQWNVLADSCANDDDHQGFPFVPKIALDNVLRRQMQIKEILADDADVLALEEVDDPFDFERALTEQRYSVLYNKREDSPLGVLVAYKDAKFELGAKNLITFKQGGQVATIVLLKEKDSKRCVVFAAAHLKAKDDSKSQTVRCSQSLEMLHHVMNMSDTWGDRVGPLNMRSAEMRGNVILAGDLNEAFAGNAVATWVDRTEFHTAYGPDENTTFKVRRTPPGKGYTIENDPKICVEDYIIHTGTTVRVRKLPGNFEYPYLPSKDFPSDHLSLCADIVFDN